MFSRSCCFQTASQNSCFGICFQHLRLEASNTGCLPKSAEEWVDKKLFFDTKSEVLSHRVELNGEDKFTREKILKQVWTSYVKDEFDLVHLFQTKAEISFAIAIMDRIDGWVEGREPDGRLAACIWIFSWAVRCNGQNYVDVSRCRKRIRLWTPLTGSVQRCKMTTTGFLSFPWHGKKIKILGALSNDTDVP